MNDNHEGQSFSSLPRPQKTAVIILSLTAIGILGIWFWQFNMRINSPFRPSNAEIAQGEKIAQEKLAAQEAEANKDSDSDGLLDYDEINIYKTSPYLEDTDGDGISDLQEIKNGSDPLCAAGSNCSAQLSGSTSTSTQNMASSTPADNVDQALIIKALSGQGDASTMRQILLQGGADPEQVKLLSDQDLMTMYAEVLKAQQPETIISTSTATSSKIN